MKKTLLLLLVVLLLIPLSPNAKVNLNTKNEVFSMLQDAFQVQVSLSEKTRTKQEIIDLLDRLFFKRLSKFVLEGEYF